MAEKPKITMLMTKSGKAALLSCEAHGNPRPTITWSRGGVAKNAVLSSTKVRSLLSVTPLTEANFGAYTCRAENIVGSTEKQLLLFHLGSVNLVLVSFFHCNNNNDNNNDNNNNNNNNKEDNDNDNGNDNDNANDNDTDNININIDNDSKNPLGEN